MTIQEKIQDEIDKIISEPLPAYHPQVGLVYAAIQGSALEIIRNKILTRLHSLGVVVKVDGDLSEIKQFKGQTRRILIQAGCGFFEPLIKGIADEGSV